MDKMVKSVPITTAKASTEGNLIFTISTNTPDRDQDILEPKGCQLKNYKKNSVVLFAHDYHSLPIGRSVNIQATDDHIEAEVEFAPTSFAQEVRTLCEQGFLKAASVGFIPLESEPIEEKDDSGELVSRRGSRYKKWDLLEWSVVPVPCNFEALIQNAKSKGIELPALKEELLPEVEVTSFGDDEKNILDPNTGEVKTEPFEDTLTIEDSEAFKEVHISGKMAEKLFVDGEPFVEKAGRILSAANEKRIKNARDSLTEVLNQIQEQDDDDKGDESDSTTLGEAIVLAGMRTAKEEEYIEFDFDGLEGDDDGIIVDMDELAEAVRETIKPELSKLKRGVTGKID